MTCLIQLPYEIQILVLQYLTIENHLDLAPLTRTCKYYAALVADKCNWSDTVTIEPTDVDSLSIHYLTQAFRTSFNSLSTRTLQAVADPETAPFVLTFLQRQQLQLEDFQIALSSEYHKSLYQTLCDNPLTKLRHFAIHDLAEEGHMMSPYEDCALLSKFLSVLSKSQSTLQALDISSFPSNVLVQCDYQFPHVTSLTIALVDDHQQKDENRFLDFWRRLKAIFPNLVELRLNLPLDHVLLFKSLLSDLPLFPWVKRLSVNSRESPKNYLSRDELRTSLLQLDGLNRITAGWDMIALN